MSTKLLSLQQAPQRGSLNLIVEIKEAIAKVDKQLRINHHYKKKHRKSKNTSSPDQLKLFLKEKFLNSGYCSKSNTA
jgi:hypothetical protein